MTELHRERNSDGILISRPARIVNSHYFNVFKTVAAPVTHAIQPFREEDKRLVSCYHTVLPALKVSSARSLTWRTT